MKHDPATDSVLVITAPQDPSVGMHRVTVEVPVPLGEDILREDGMGDAMKADLVAVYSKYLDDHCYGEWSYELDEQEREIARLEDLHDATSW